MANMEIQTSPYSRYSIRVRDSHAFPEVYISGYGWLSFEPTVPMDVTEQETAENHYVMLWGFWLLGAAGIVLLGVFLTPGIKERLFRRRLAKLPPREAASAVFLHMRKVLKLPDSTAVSELVSSSALFCPEEFLEDLPAQLDALLYGIHDPENAPSFHRLYTAWFGYWQAYRKEQRRKKHRKD